MKKQLKKFALAATIGLTLAFTFNCSSGKYIESPEQSYDSSSSFGGNGGDSPSSLSVGSGKSSSSNKGNGADPAYMGVWRRTPGGNGPTVTHELTIESNTLVEYVSYFNAGFTLENITWEPRNNGGITASSYPKGYAITGTITNVSYYTDRNIGELYTDYYYISNDGKTLCWGGSSIAVDHFGVPDVIFSKVSGGGGGDPIVPPSTDCSRYQSEYNVRKAQVERCERNVQTALNAYSMAGSGTSLSMAQTNLTRAETELRNAETNLASTERQAANAGCSVY